MNDPILPDGDDAAVDDDVYITMSLEDEEPQHGIDRFESIDALAREVMAGQHGLGEDRKASLGDNYREVMDRVRDIRQGL